MKHIIGENYLCFYSLMEMILDDLGYVEWNQFSLANQFGVVLPNNYVISGVKNVKISNDERMYGAHIDCRKIKIIRKVRTILIIFIFIFIFLIL